MNIYAIKNLLLSQNPVSKLYVQRYIKLIEYAIENPTKEKYTERHHILPKSMFPEYKDGRKFKWNLVKLSARQHFIAHWMLWKAFRNESMTYAFWMMKHVSNKNHNRYDKMTSRIYEELRKEVILLNKGRNYSEESKMKMSISQNKRYENPEERNKTSIAGKKRFSKELEREKQSERLKGKKRTKETKKKISEARIGKKLSEETKKKISEINKGKKHSDESKKKRSESSKNWRNSFTETEWEEYLESRRKFIYTFTKENGEKIEDKTIKNFSKKYGYNSCQLSMVFTGKSKFHKDIVKVTRRKK